MVRGAIFARLASYVSGVSGVSATLAGHVAGMLAGPIPTVPRDASAGSGEILPLGHLFAQVPERVHLGAKEAMVLVNGSPCAGAMTADLTLRSRNLWPILLDISGLALDALNASDAHYDAALGDVWGTPVETAVLGDLRVRLADPSAPRASKQSRVSVRILPRVLAALSRAARDLEDVAQVALRYPGDNPSFVDSGTPGPRIISNGSFHQHQAVVAIDQYSRALSDLVRLAQHLLHALYQDEYAMPGQDNLALGVSYMAAAAWSEEARLNAAPSLLSFAAVGQNDVPNPLFSAWNKADRVNRCATAQFALLGAMASQALYLSKRPATPELQSTLELVRRHVAPIERRRDVGPDIAALDSELAGAVANFDQPG